MKTFNEYKETRNNQESIVNALSLQLNSFEKDNTGMVIESIRMTNEYKALKNNFNVEYNKLQNITIYGVRNFKKELTKERKEKRGQRFN